METHTLRDPPCSAPQASGARRAIGLLVVSLTRASTSVEGSASVNTNYLLQERFSSGGCGENKAAVTLKL